MEHSRAAKTTFLITQRTILCMEKKKSESKYDEEKLTMNEVTLGIP